MLQFMIDSVSITPGQHMISNRATTFSSVETLKITQVPAKILSKNVIMVYKRDDVIIRRGYVIHDEELGDTYIVNAYTEYPEFYRADVDVKNV